VEHPLFIISFLTGSLGPTTGNKDKFGRLRSVHLFEINNKKSLLGSEAN